MIGGVLKSSTETVPVAATSSARPDAVDEIIDEWGRVRPEVDVSALNVFGRLHRSFLIYRDAINAGFSQTGTNEPGFDVLAALRRAVPTFTLTAGDLAKQTLVTTGGLTLRVNRLEKEGYVVRHRDAEDQRIVHVQLTASGLQLIDRATDAHYANLNRLLTGLSPEEQETLATLLSKLYGSMRAAAPEIQAEEAR